ncbi:hypothetical protein RB195_013713 [Necator americanus]|uniref:Uncharacterized protein n=1 Tax=Necator americanus TaxID=51031 RepID=A0ABR1DWT3_NECAM
MKNESSTTTHKRRAGDEMPDSFVKGEIHEKNVMLSALWRVHGIYRFELLPDNTTVAAEVYCVQLQRLADKIRKEHPKLDNVRLLHETRALTLRRRLPRKFWTSDGKFYRTHCTDRTWPRTTSTSSDRFSISWKKSATVIVTTLKMTFGLSLPPIRRSSTPKESVIP